MFEKKKKQTITNNNNTTIVAEMRCGFLNGSYGTTATPWWAHHAAVGLLLPHTLLPHQARIASQGTTSIVNCSSPPPPIHQQQQQEPPSPPPVNSPTRRSTPERTKFGELYIYFFFFYAAFKLLCARVITPSQKKNNT